MGHHQSRASHVGRVGDDCAQWEIDPALFTLIIREVNTAGTRIEMGDPQDFRTLAGEAAFEKLSRGIDPSQGHWRFGTLKHVAKIMRSPDLSERNRIRFGGTTGVTTNHAALASPRGAR